MPEYDSTISYGKIPRFPGYQIGSDGSIWSCRTNSGISGTSWHRLKLRKAPKTGYHFVMLYPDRVMLLIHRLVLEAFIGPCPKGMECRHIDGDRNNNCLSNLCWGTRLDNMADRERHGNTARGTRHGRAILNEEKVRAIRLTRATTSKTIKEIAEEHSVNYQMVLDIIHRRRWAHVN